MEQEVKQEKQVNSEDDFFNEPSLEDIISQADEYVNGEKVEKKEEPEKSEAVETEAKAEETVEKKPEKQTDGKAESEETVELTDEEFEKLAAKYPDLKRYRESHLDHANWEKNLRQKAQAIGFIGKLPAEQQELLWNKILPYAYKQEELPKNPGELVEEMVDGLEIQGFSFQDEDDLDVMVGPDQLKPHIKKYVSSVLQKAVPEMAALRQQLESLTKERDELKDAHQATRVRMGDLELEGLVKKHESLNIRRVDDNESILKAIGRIHDAGDSHPEAQKLLKLQAVGDLADRKGWTLEQAYKHLYGEEDTLIRSQKRAEQAIISKQKGDSQERPDGKQIDVPDWQAALEGVGERESKIDGIFRKAGI